MSHDVRLAIVGTRSVEDKGRVYFEINEARKIIEARGGKIVLIISGIGADEYATRGVDYFAREYARDNGIPYKGYPAAWDNMAEPCIRRTNNKGQVYNALAGPNRNTNIVTDATHVLALHLNASPGTQDSINKVRAHNKREPANKKHLKIVNL